MTHGASDINNNSCTGKRIDRKTIQRKADIKDGNFDVDIDPDDPHKEIINRRF